MSRVKIEGNATGSGTLTISAPATNTDRSLTLPDTAGEILTSTDGTIESAITTQLSHRNLIINGDMRVAQRDTSVTGVSSADAYRVCDRWYTNMNSLGAYTISQDTDVPNGFKNSLKYTCTTADASPAAGDYFQIGQRLEAQDLEQLNYGNASAKSITLSFWVKSNKTGTYNVRFYRTVASTRMASVQYTINSSATWEYKTITLDGDTSVALTGGAVRGLDIVWWLAAGSNFTSGSEQSWGGYVAANEAPSNVNLSDATSNYWQITGVQLEVGSVATPYEHRSYGEELSRCQRYVQVLSQTEGPYSYNLLGVRDSAWYLFNYWMTVPMRAAPTLTSTASLSGLDYGTATGTVNIYNLSINNLSTWTAGTGYYTTTKATTQKISIRFTGTSFNGNYGDNMALDGFVVGSPVWLDAEL